MLCLVKKKLQDNGQWINNVTYCGGRHDKCDTNIIVTIANVSMPVPGVSLDLQLRRFTLTRCRWYTTTMLTHLLHLSQKIGDLCPFPILTMPS